MRIACPSCDAEYDVPISRMKPGKMVRCARCGGEWVASELEANAEEAGLAPPPLDFEGEAGTEFPLEVAATDHHLAASRPPPPPSVGLIAAWVSTIIVLVGAVSATIVWRQDIVRHWPPSSRILGLPDTPVAKTDPRSGASHDTK